MLLHSLVCCGEQKNRFASRGISISCLVIESNEEPGAFSYYALCCHTSMAINPKPCEHLETFDRSPKAGNMQSISVQYDAEGKKHAQKTLLTIIEQKSVKVPM